MPKTKPFDTAEHLDTPEVIAEYLNLALESGDPDQIAMAIGNVARAKGMTNIARETDLNRQALYQSLSAGGNPEFSTVTKVLDAMGIQLVAKVKEAA